DYYCLIWHNNDYWVF
nr:immunoglobulin light chain junction region [Macaca mulatta]MOY04904.1 immunoglobulin light chain junction region [Macaca mulatta]MOY05089.1 immunoglobulin light chain junction region [Macaca mulatta]MOY05169.1 immunoglobulin light chain junction region [Macaca mulatta]MOY05372.1 immunoglobulin light chain junction region [Macaca mulatta]